MNLRHAAALARVGLYLMIAAAAKELIAGTERAFTHTDRPAISDRSGPVPPSTTPYLCAGGGPDSSSLDANASAEIYDPRHESFEATGSMTRNGGRFGHSAELLPDGKVLILGGMFVGPDGSSGVAQDNLYDPETGVFSCFTATNWSAHQTVTQFQPGRLLIVGETFPANTVFDYAARTGSYKFPLLTPVAAHSATRLADSSVLIAGGYAARGVRFGSVARPGLALDRGATFQLSNGWRWVDIDWGGWILSAAAIFQPSMNGFVAVGSMSIPRFGHTATLLKNGQVLIAGGFTGKSFTSSCEIFDPGSKAFRPGPAMHEARIGHNATLLADGEVLIAGGFNGKEFNKSAELYDPKTGKFEQVGMLETARESATATLLPNGTVLVAGGHNSAGVTQHCELFDPRNKGFRATADLIHPRYSHSATLLSNKRVLIAGGGLAITPSTAAGEVFDPATKRFIGVTSLAGIDVPPGRVSGPWTRLPDGRIFEVYWGRFAEGYVGPPVVSTINDLETGKMQSAPPMNVVRVDVTVTSLKDGRVLVAGGNEPKPSDPVSAIAELYDVRSNRFIVTGRMTVPRTGHTATCLKDGRVLIVGGSTRSGVLASAELYDPTTGKFSRTGSMATARQGARAAMMSDGRVLIVGGSDASGPIFGAEVYDPVSGTFSVAGKMMSCISPEIVITLSSGAVLIMGEPFRPFRRTAAHPITKSLWSSNGAVPKQAKRRDSGNGPRHRSGTY